MRQYANRGGDSGVVGFELTANGIIVHFYDGGVYLYGSRRPGPRHVSRMRKLALAGEGLNGYINREVRFDYEAKLA